MSMRGKARYLDRDPSEKRIMILRKAAEARIKKTRMQATPTNEQCRPPTAAKGPELHQVSSTPTHVLSDFLALATIRVVRGDLAFHRPHHTGLASLIGRVLRQTDELGFSRDLCILALLLIKRVSGKRACKPFREGSEGALFVVGFILALKMSSDASVKSVVWSSLTNTSAQMLASIEHGFLTTLDYGTYARLLVTSSHW
ncbi:MAG: hypothetical protein SGCHY_002855 [Lobulomycetales sp.]